MCYLSSFASWIVLYFAIQNCLLRGKDGKDKKSKIFSYFRKAKSGFLARSHTISSNKGLSNAHTFALVSMQTCACLKEHMRDVIDHVFCTLCTVCPCSAVSWNHQHCNRQSMQRVQNAWPIGTGLCLNARTQMYFSKQPFSWFWS